MAAKKKQHKYKPPEKRDVTENDRLEGWEPDRSLLEVRSYRQPSPYEIASLSISLAKGKDPKNHLEDAYNLY